jgi:hypothetical protein
MAGTTSAIQISSNALILLGHPPIASFDEPGAGPQAATNLYEQSYLNMLTIHRWRFATKKAQLSRLSEAPLNGYTYQFQLPSDLLYLIRKDIGTTYEIFGDKLHSNNATEEIDYLYRVNEDNLPPYFIKAFEFFMASQLAIPVVGNSTRADYYAGMYEMQLKRAKFADSTQRPQDSFSSSPYTQVRF